MPDHDAGLDAPLPPSGDRRSDAAQAPRQEALAAIVREQLALLGERPERDGLRETPARVARALTFLTAGTTRTAADAIGGAVFAVDTDQMVMVRDIEFYSMCEHHLLPFHGRAHIAYIPNGTVVGLSKLARVVDVYARRLQVQERLGEQIAAALEEVLRPQGVGVVLEALHLCMMMRGVQQQGARTVTSALRGAFRDDEATRHEFLRLAHAE